MAGTISKILVCVDGSEHSEMTVQYAAAVLPKEDTEITLFHVDDHLPNELRQMNPQPRYVTAIRFDELKKQIVEAGEAFMNGYRNLLLESGFPDQSISTIVRPVVHGPARDILEYASTGFNAVFVGRWGHGGFRDFVFGGTTQRMINKLQDHILCVVAGRPMGKRFLVTLDTSRESRRVLEFLAALPDKHHRRLLLFHAIKKMNLPPYVFDMDSVREAMSVMLEEQKDDVESELETCRDELLEWGFPEEAVSVKVAAGVDSRSISILNQAREGRYGSIVMARKNPPASDGFIMGRVPNKVIQKAHDRAVWLIP